MEISTAYRYKVIEYFNGEPFQIKYFNRFDDAVAFRDKAVEQENVKAEIYRTKHELVKGV